MYLDMGEDLIKKVQAITCTDYDCKGDFMPYESIIPLIEDLLYEIDRKEEELEDLKQDIENNYEVKNINPYEEYGVSINDFIER